MAPKFTKRPATDEEVIAALKAHIMMWNDQNPSYIKPDSFWEEKQKKALREGYKNEVCSCGVTYLAFHHFTICNKKSCPFSDGVSLLDRMAEQVE